MVATVSFPLGLGQFMAADLTTHDQVCYYVNFYYKNGLVELCFVFTGDISSGSLSDSDGERVA